MEKSTKCTPFLLLFVLLFQTSTALYTMGVNYGTLGDNLPPPAQVASFLKTHTSIDKVKIFDTNPEVLKAFANTGILVTVTVGNGDIPSLNDPAGARTWVANQIAPFHPQTKIHRIVMGNEIMATADRSLIGNLVPAMKTLYNALKLAGITDVQVTTPNSLGVLSISDPPSLGRFRRGYDKIIFGPLLQFHRDTKSPFMVNPYPYFGFDPNFLNYAIFKPNPGKRDAATGNTYTNMFDAQVDAVYSAMQKLGYGDVDIVIGETGWPSLGDPDQPYVTVENAVSYNQGLVQHVSSGKGTPLMPNKKFETYIFSLFNENLKPGTSAERNFGLFKPDLTPVYNIGILRDGSVSEPPQNSLVGSNKTEHVAPESASGPAPDRLQIDPKIRSVNAPRSAPGSAPGSAPISAPGRLRMSPALGPNVGSENVALSPNVGSENVAPGPGLGTKTKSENVKGSSTSLGVIGKFPYFLFFILYCLHFI